MKMRILVLALCVFPLVSGQTLHWIKTYGNSGYDFGEDVKQTLDTGYIATGASSSFPSATADAYLLKVDSTGVFEWSHPYGGSGSDWGEKVVLTLDSGYAIAGYTNSFGAGGFDFYLIRADSLGDPEWTKTYGGTDWDYGRSLVQLDDSGFILVGETYSFGEGNRDAYIIRTDKNGDTLWTRTYGGPEDDYASDIILDGDSIVVVGGTRSFGAGDEDGLILKYHIDGTIGTIRYIGQIEQDYFTSITQEDTFYVLGGARSYHHDSGCDCGKDFWIYKIVNNVDTILADTSWTGTSFGDDIANDVAVGLNNNTFYGGSTTSWGNPDISLGLTDAFLGKHLNNYYSVFDYVKNFGQINSDAVNGIDTCYDRGLVSAGTMKYLSTGGYNMFIARVDEFNSWAPGIDVVTDMTSENITLGHEQLNQQYFAVFPTPAYEWINVMGVQELAFYRITDMNGRLVQDGTIDSNEISVALLDNGVYVLQVLVGKLEYIVRIAVLRG